VYVLSVSPVMLCVLEDRQVVISYVHVHLSQRICYTCSQQCYLSDAMLVRILALVICLSIHPSVPRQHCLKTAKHRMMQTMPHDSQGTSFLMPTVVDGRRPIPPEICAESDPPPLSSTLHNAHVHRTNQPIFLLSGWHIGLKVSAQGSHVG